jgi:hypothetical protein
VLDSVTQLVVDEREQVGRGRRVPGRRGIGQAGHIGHGRGCNDSVRIKNGESRATRPGHPARPADGSLAAPGDETVPESAGEVKGVFRRVLTDPYGAVAGGELGSILLTSGDPRFVGGRRSGPPGSVVVATGSGNRSGLARLLPTHSFARDRPRLPRAVRPGRARPTRTRLGANSSPAEATPLKASCGRAPTRRPGPRIHGFIRVGLAGRELEGPNVSSGRTTGPPVR